MLAVALAMMFAVFGQVPINDAMIARYTAEEWRARAYSVRYVMSFAASAFSVPLVAFIHRTTGGFGPLFTLLAALALVGFAAALAFPGERQSAPAAAPSRSPARTRGYRSARGLTEPVKVLGLYTSPDFGTLQLRNVPKSGD